MDSTQQDICQRVAMPVVEDVLRGINGTIFAYGQVFQFLLFNRRLVSETKKKISLLKFYYCNFLLKN